MKILLVRYLDEIEAPRVPKIFNDLRGVLPNLSILYLAAYVRKFGHEVKIFDAPARIQHQAENEYIQCLKEFQPSVVGVTTMLETYQGACHACKLAKKYGATTVLGGHGMEIYPIDMIDKEFIDYGVVGEGEETFLSLIEAIEKKDTLAIEAIPGLSYKSREGIVAGAPQTVSDLDTIPTLAYDLIDVKDYQSIFNDYPVMTYMIGRGCPFQCSFCIKNTSDDDVRFRSVKLVVDDIEHLVSFHGIKELVFYDDTFTLHRKQVRSICEELIRRKVKIKWEAVTRIDALIQHDGIEFLKLMKKAGLVRLRLGVESGDADLVETMVKEFSLESVELAFKRCKEVGVETAAFFLIAYVNETYEQFKNTVDFAMKIDPDYVSFSIATPYPTTPLYKEAFDEGLIPEDYWRDFIQGKTTARIPYLVDDAEKRSKVAYQRFYFRPKFILRRMFNTLKNITYIKNGFKAVLALIYYQLPTSITPGVTRKPRSSETLQTQDTQAIPTIKVSPDTAALRINPAQKKRGIYVKGKTIKNTAGELTAVE